MTTDSSLKLARLSLAGPSPLIRLERLGRALGGIDLYIKRDDLGSIGGGGNKLRKLEFSVAQALAEGCDTLITFGALQSNHARLSAAVAAQQGLRCELILNRKVPRATLHYEQGGNLALDRIFGADLHVLAADDDPLAFCDARVQALKAEGRKPYVIPFGGSDALGAIGYAECVTELVSQAAEAGIAIDRLYHGSGSGGTQAGLMLGAQRHGATFAIQGISVLNKQEALANIVHGILAQARERLALSPVAATAQVDDQYVGPGYGIPDARTHQAIELMARTEGVVLDPVYTGKAFAGLVGHVREKRVAPGETIVFLHTGGLPGVFAYADAFGPPV